MVGFGPDLVSGSDVPSMHADTPCRTFAAAIAYDSGREIDVLVPATGPR